MDAPCVGVNNMDHPPIEPIRTSQRLNFLDGRTVG